MSGIFGKDFFPTPQEVVNEMISNLDLKGQVVLEPSAGSGAIIDILKLCGAEVIICELSDELAQISSQKADRFLKNDFLEVTKEEISHIHYIIQNPPFSADEKHILHAWDIAPEGCNIISLCNWETLDNTYTRERRLLKSIIQENGTKSNLGDVFSTAERKTNINIGLVNLFKPRVTEETEFDGYFDLSEDQEQHQENGIMTHNSMLEIVNRYVGAVKMFDSVMQKNEEINKLISPIDSGLNIKFGAYKTDGRYSSNISRSEFKKGLQKSSWRSVFKKMKMDKYVTNKVMSDINKFVEQQEKVPFTLKNIYKMIDMIIGTNDERMNTVIVEVFDWLTERHIENRLSHEGWKTNSEYRVNKKFIAPYSNVGIGYSGKPETRWSSDGYRIDDLVKALCLITGTNYDNCQTIEQCFNRREVPNYNAQNAINELSKLIPYNEKQCKHIHERFKYFTEGDQKQRDRSLNETKYSLELSDEVILILKKFYTEKGYTEKDFGTMYEYKEFGKWYDFNFFEIKVFKKGTLHAKFKDDKVWEQFNKVACSAKGFQLASKYTSDFHAKETGVEIYN